MLSSVILGLAEQSARKRPMATAPKNGRPISVFARGKWWRVFYQNGEWLLHRYKELDGLNGVFWGDAGVPFEIPVTEFEYWRTSLGPQNLDNKLGVKGV